MSNPARHMVLTCRRCGGEFECFSTKSRWYCAPCRKIVDRERNRVDMARHRAKIDSGKIKPKDQRPKLIPYAGFDKNERHL